MLITCQYGHALDIAPFGLHLEWLQCPTCEDESVVMLTPEGEGLQDYLLSVTDEE